MQDPRVPSTTCVDFYISNFIGKKHNRGFPSTVRVPMDRLLTDISLSFFAPTPTEGMQSDHEGSTFGTLVLIFTRRVPPSITCQALDRSTGGRTGQHEGALVNCPRSVVPRVRNTNVTDDGEAKLRRVFARWTWIGKR